MTEPTSTPDRPRPPFPYEVRQWVEEGARVIGSEASISAMDRAEWREKIARALFTAWPGHELDFEALADAVQPILDEATAGLREQVGTLTARLVRETDEHKQIVAEMAEDARTDGDEAAADESRAQGVMLRLRDERDKARAQVALAEQWSEVQGRKLADGRAVAARARREAEQLRGELAEARDENLSMRIDHAAESVRWNAMTNSHLGDCARALADRAQLQADLRRLRLAYRSACRRATNNRHRAYLNFEAFEKVDRQIGRLTAAWEQDEAVLRWLHAEAAWQRDQLCAEVERKRAIVVSQVEIGDMAAAMLRARLDDARAEVVRLRAQQAGMVRLPAAPVRDILDALDVREIAAAKMEALADLIASWRSTGEPETTTAVVAPVADVSEQPMRPCACGYPECTRGRLGM